MTDPYLAYCIDEAAALAGIDREVVISREAEAGQGNSTSPGPARGGVIQDANGVLTINGRIPVIRKPSKV